MWTGIACRSANISVAGLSNLTRVLERVLGVHSARPRDNQESKEPTTERYKRDTALLLAKSRRQRTMLGGIVERHRPIEMLPGLPRCNP